MYQLDFTSTDLYRQVRQAFTDFAHENQSSIINKKIIFSDKESNIKLDFDWFKAHLMFPQILLQFCKKPCLLSREHMDEDITVKELNGDIKRRYKKHMRDLRAEMVAVSSNFSKSSQLPRFFSLEDFSAYCLASPDSSMAVIGDYYNVSPRKFLLENFKDFKELGCQQIFLEYLSVSDQRLLDEWFFDQDLSLPLPREIEIYVMALDLSFVRLALNYGADAEFERNYRSFDLRHMLFAAKAAGIRPMAFEDDLSLYSLRNDAHILPSDRVKIVRDRLENVCLAEGKLKKSLFFLSPKSVLPQMQIANLASDTEIKIVSIHDDNLNFPDKPESVMASETDYFNQMELCFSEHDINRLISPNEYHLVNLLLQMPQIKLYNNF